jgi:hypothetical protein
LYPDFLKPTTRGQLKCGIFILIKFFACQTFLGGAPFIFRQGFLLRLILCWLKQLIFVKAFEFLFKHQAPV